MNGKEKKNIKSIYTVYILLTKANKTAFLKPFAKLSASNDYI